MKHWFIGKVDLAMYKQLKNFLLFITLLALLLSGCGSLQQQASAEILRAEKEVSLEVNQLHQSQAVDQAEILTITPSNSEQRPIEALVVEANAPEQVVDSNEPKGGTPLATSGETSQIESQPGAVVTPARSEALPPAEPRVGFLAPDLTLTSLDGNSIKFSDLRGKNIIINYWVTWCAPCKDELPALDKISRDYQNKNLVVISVNGINQDQIDAVHELVDELGLTHQIALDEDQSFWETYLVHFLPTSFFIDSDGIIRYIQLGSSSEENFRDTVDRLLAGQL